MQQHQHDDINTVKSYFIDSKKTRLSSFISPTKNNAMDRIEKKCLCIILLLVMYLIVLMPLAATVLVFMACYLPLIEMSAGYAVDNKSYSFEKISYSVGADIYDGSTPRNISIAVRAIGCLISLLFYTLLWSPWKLCSRTLLLGLLTVSQVILLINFILTSTDILSCPRNRCSTAIAIKCLFGALFCTTFGVLVGGGIMPGLVQIWVKDFWLANEDWFSGTSRVVESTQDEESPAPPAQGKENLVAEPVIIHVKVPDR